MSVSNSSSLRLVVLAEDFYPNVSGGAHERWRFCELAAEAGHDVTVFTPRRTGTDRHETERDVEIVRPFPAKPAGKPAYSTVALLTRLLYSVGLFVVLLWWLSRTEADALLSDSHSMHWVGKLLAVLYALPLVTIINYTPSANEQFQLQPKFLRERLNFRLFLGERVFCRSERVAAIVRATSGADVSVLHGILNIERIVAAADTLNESAVRRRFGIDPDDRFVVFVGRLVPIKNPTGVIETLRQLPAEYTLLMIGDGPLEPEIRESVHQQGLDDRVVFAGTLPHTETLHCIAAAELLLLSSDGEAYPTVVFEALALGSQVVATPVGILPELDHARLSLGPVKQFPSLIADQPAGETALDTDTLDQFSMERYTDTVLAAFETLVSGRESWGRDR